MSDPSVIVVVPPTSDAESFARIGQALALLDQVPRLSDVGTHWDGCHLTGHTDCLATRLERILGGAE